MDFRTDYFSASGSFVDGYCFLAHRYDPHMGFRRKEAESIVVRKMREPGKKSEDGILLQIVFETTGRLVELWRSSTGNVFIAEAMGEVSQSRMVGTEKRTAWKTTKLDASLHGVWGLDDATVFAFGRDGGKSAMALWNGRQWTDIKPPSFEVEAMHGLSSDSIWACGAGGKVARWSGKAWQELKVPSDEMLLSIFVAAPGEYYASGSMGNIFEGTDTGWQTIGSIPDAFQGDVQAVAKFEGKLWVGASRLGLWQRKGKTNKYVCVKPNIPAVSFDTRDGFLIGAETAVCSTEDGKSFEGEAVGFVAEQRESFALGEF